jgi:hypothetical protein
MIDVFRQGFTEDQLKILRAALNNACADLGIAETDEAAREIVAETILSLGAAGQFDPERLRTYAVYQCRHRRGRLDG